jgi:putative Mg2+ transporter-C (MgtC) family protein
MLVAMASTSFTQVGAYGFQTPGQPHDAMRVAAQVVTGIGFLGAGAIWRTGLAPRGLTTAAGLWVSAALGMLAAAGFYGAAVAITILAWVVLRGGYELECRLGVKGAPFSEGADDAGNAGEQDNAS